MQQAPPQEQVGYASLGMRFAAVLVDTLVLFGVLILIMTVYVAVLASQGKVNPNDPAAAQELSRQIAASGTQVDLLFFAALFVYYAIMEAAFSASVGKLVFGMRVVMRDGSRATGSAVVVRNLVRIPEAMFLYIPAGVSYLASPQCQRLGDRAARTVVVRMHTAQAAVAFGAPPALPGATPPGAPAPVPPPAAPGAAWPQAEAPVVPDVPPSPAPPSPAEALARLKTAALATRGAHLAYLHFSELELAAGADEQAGEYSQGYVSAWFTLTDAVTGLREARLDLDRAAAASAQTVEEVAAAQPDLAHQLIALGPYFTATGDEGIHEAFLAVARAEAADS